MFRQNHIAESVDGTHKAEVDILKGSFSIFTLRPSEPVLKSGVKLSRSGLGKCNSTDFTYIYALFHHRGHSFNKNACLAGACACFHKVVGGNIVFYFVTG